MAYPIDICGTGLNRSARARALPAIKVDNGSEFISRVSDNVPMSGIELDFSRPGKPSDNAKVES